MKCLPKFNLSAYSDLLIELRDKGARFRPICDIVKPESKDVFLRHDLDFSLELSLPMAKIEHELGISGTYYVLLSGPYNPCSAVSVQAMQELILLGHKLGLHYDLSLYPVDKDAARKRILHEIAFLSELSGATVDTIVMHEPSRGQQDLFETTSEWINPTFYQKNNPHLMYVSDSCRAWRDDSILSYVNDEAAQKALLLNTHPESWLAKGSQHRLTYLEETLLPKVLLPVQRYFKERVRHSWQTHVGPVGGFGDEDE
jgi:hypothetical protein